MRALTVPHLRAATHGDLAALQALVEEYYAFDGIPFDTQVRAGLKALLADSALGIAWLWELDGAAAGYAVLTFGYDHELGGRTGTLTDFYLKREFRGRGHGTAALRRVEDEARQLGLRALELQVTRQNLPALKLYRKLGYTAFDRVPMAKRLS